MPTREDLARPLSAAEWETLVEMLDEPGGPNLDFCVGMLTAVATAPTPGELTTHGRSPFSYHSRTSRRTVDVQPGGAKSRGS
jgi:hypothetical protein